MIRYLDTAAALKLIVDEPESDALARDLSAGAQRGDTLVAALLLYTELHCAARRRGIDNPETVSALLDAVTLIDVSRDDFLRAGASS
ncbi:MAG: VapC toxin family PIN domain ribonuclease, partial [Mobilicoccus sp.]|nr:VapC toxin family PIN domain ribonuclease [Mobilicoccus sp.]